MTQSGHDMLIGPVSSRALTDLHFAQSARREAVRLQDWRCVWSSNELYESVGGIGRFARRGDTRGKQCHAAEIARQRSEYFRTRDRNNFRALRHAQFGFALGDKLGSLDAGHQNRFRLEFISQAELIDNLGEVDAA